MISNKKLSKDKYDYELSFNTKDIPLYYLTFIRRTLMNKTNGYRFDNIIFKSNTTLICNEIIIERLSKIPVSFNNKHDFIINEINNDEDIKIIYSENIKYPKEYKYDIIPGLEICRLQKDEELYCTFNISSGNGELHADYRPIITCSIYPINNDECGGFIESCFDNIYESLSDSINFIKLYNSNIIDIFNTYLKSDEFQKRITNLDNQHIIKIENNIIPLEYINIFSKVFNIDNDIKFIHHYRKFYSDDFILLKIIMESPINLINKITKCTVLIENDFKHLINLLIQDH